MCVDVFEDVHVCVALEVSASGGVHKLPEDGTSLKWQELP